MTGNDIQWVASCILLTVSGISTLGAWGWVEDENRPPSTRWFAAVKVVVFALCGGCVTFTIMHYWVIPKFCVGAALWALMVYMIVRTGRQIGEPVQWARGDLWLTMNLVVLGAVIYILVP